MQEHQSAPLVPPYLVRLLDQVLKGEASPEVAKSELGVGEITLGTLLRALIRQRATEQQWELPD